MFFSPAVVLNDQLKYEGSVGMVLKQTKTSLGDSKNYPKKKVRK